MAIERTMGGLPAENSASDCAQCVRSVSAKARRCMTAPMRGWSRPCTDESHSDQYALRMLMKSERTFIGSEPLMVAVKTKAYCFDWSSFEPSILRANCS